MQYKTHRLIRSYGKDSLTSARHFFGVWLARLDLFLALAWEWLGQRWNDSLLCRYLACMREDATRALALTQRRGYVAFCLAFCGLMSLGFLVISPQSGKGSYHVRIDMNRPVVTSLSRAEAYSYYPLSHYELAALYEAGTGKSARDWLHAGELDYDLALSATAAGSANAAATSYEAAGSSAPSGKIGSGGWQSNRSPLAVSDGRIVLRTALGDKPLQTLGQLQPEFNSTDRPRRPLAAYAAGASSPEALLAELSLQTTFGGKPPRTGRANFQEERWKRDNYGLNLFEEPKRHWSGALLAESAAGDAGAALCSLDRMEKASWLNMLYASHSRKAAYTVRQAASYRPYVERYASQYSLQPSLVYAIMRVESGFNPLAISTANALGLMQVVPDTAGNEVHAFLNGKKVAPAPELLFAPESNIQYGTTYLHLLMTRHFGEIKNPLSREMCIIAGYNGGPNAVYRVFSRDRARAVEQINKLTPEQLYDKLTKEMYAQETREYLPKVLAARNEFLRGLAKIE